MRQWINAQYNVFVQNCVEVSTDAVENTIILGRERELLVACVVNDLLAIGVRKLEESLRLVNVVNVL